MTAPGPRPAVFTAVVLVALVAAGCGGGSGSRAQPSPGPPPGLPPATFEDLAPIFEPQVAPLGVRVTRAALVDTLTRRPSPTGGHLALYVEPTESWTLARYAGTIVPLTRVLAPGMFDRWPGLKSFDVCQEPPPGLDDRPEPPTVATVDLTRQASASIDWETADLASLLAAASQPQQGVHVIVSKELRAEPAFQDAQAAAADPGAPGD